MNSRIVALGLSTVIALTAALTAQENGAARFTFVVPNAPESTVDGKGPLQLTVQRWSTDEERDRLLTNIADGGSARLLDAFRSVGAVGYMRWPGGLEYTLRYARLVARPGGQTDVVLVADHPVWVWWDQALSASARSADHPFTVIQLRLDAQGTGEGRMSANVASDPQAGVVLADYDKQPVLMTGVTR